jgi:hypothetical protein
VGIEPTGAMLYQLSYTGTTIRLKTVVLININTHTVVHNNPLLASIAEHMKKYLGLLAFGTKHRPERSLIASTTQYEHVSLPPVLPPYS